MIRLSKLTDYAVVILAAMAREPGTLFSAARVAQVTGVPEPTSSKVLKLLVKSQIVTSVRGVSGGYRLERAAADLPVAAIIAAMEGPISLTSCVSGSRESCALESKCAVHGRWTPVNAAIRGALEGVTLADMGGR